MLCARVWVCLPACGHGRGNRARLSGRAASPSTRPLGVYIYAVGPRSCRIRRAQKGSARLRPRPWPRMAPSGAGPRRRMLVSPSGEKLDSSRALHPPSAARYFVGGIPPPRLARVRWRITRTGVSPFPCARSSHASSWPDLPLRRIFLRSFCGGAADLPHRLSWLAQSATNWESRHLGGVSNCRDFVRAVISFCRA